MAVSSIKFKISADVKELKSAMAEASRAVSDTASKAKSSGGMLSGLTNGLKSVGSAALGAMGHVAKMAASITIFKAINSTLNMVGSSVQSAFNRADTMYTFDRAMTRITGSSDEAKKVLEEVNETVKGTPYGLDIAAKAVQGFANSNLGVKDSVRYVESWADAVSAYGDGSNDTLSRVTFQLNQMASKGKVSLEELNVAMEAGIPALQIYADATGQTVAEVRDQISAGEITATQFFETMDTAFRDGTGTFKSIAGEAKAAGATWQGAFDNMRAATTRGVLGIIEAIDSGLVSAGVPTIKEAIGLYGKYLESGLKSLAGKVAPAISTIAKTIKGAMPVIDQVFNAFQSLATTVGGSLLAAFGTAGGKIGSVFSQIASFITDNMGTIETVVTTVIEIATGVFLGLGDTIEILIPVFSQLIQWLGSVIEGIRSMLPEGTNLTDLVRKLTPIILASVVGFKALKGGVSLASGAFKTFTGVLDGVNKFRTFVSAVNGGTRAFASLSPVAKVLASSLKLVGTVAKTMGTLVVGAFKAIGAAVMAHPILAAIAAIIAVLILLWTKCDWFREGVIAVWEAVKSAFSDATEAVGKWMSDMGDKISEVWTNIKNWFKDAGDSISNNMSQLGDKISEVWAGIVGWFNKAGETIGQAIDGMVDWFKKAGTAIANTWNSISSAFMSSIEFIGNVVSVGFQLVYNTIEGIIKLVASIIIATLDTIRYFWQIGWKIISDYLKDVWNGIKNFLEPHLQKMAEFFKTVWNNVKSFTTSIWNGIKAFFVSLWNGIVNIVKPIVTGLSNFIKSTWDKIKTLTTTIWNGIKNFFVSAWNSMSAFMKPIVTGISNFIKTAWNNIKNFTKASWDAIKSVTSSVWNGIKSYMNQVLNGLKKIVTTVFNFLKTHITNIWNGVKSVTSSVWNNIKSFMSSVWNGIKSVVSSAINSVKSVISSAWNTVKSITSSIWNGIKSFISTVWNGIKSIISGAVNSAKSIVSGAWNGIRSITSSVWNGIRNTISSAINGAKNTVGNAISAIKGFFNNLRLKFPDIRPPKLPHFSLSGSFSLKPPSVPKLSVDWYETGGIFTGDSVIGVGENGTEAVVPLSNKSHMKPFASAVASMIKEDGNDNSTNNNGGNGVVIKENTFIVRKESDIRKIGQELVREADRRDGSKGKRRWDD